MLPEEKRKQLDDIVAKASANGESDATISAIVDDFKLKYSKPDKSGSDRVVEGLKQVAFPGVALERGYGDLKRLLGGETGTSVLQNPTEPDFSQIGAGPMQLMNSSFGPLYQHAQAGTDYLAGKAGLGENKSYQQSLTDVLNTLQNQQQQAPLTSGIATALGFQNPMGIAQQTAKGASTLVTNPTIQNLLGNLLTGQTMIDPRASAGDRTTQGVVDTAASLIPAGIAKAAPVVGNAAKRLFGFTTGVGSDILEQAYRNPQAVKSAIKMTPEERSQAVVGVGKQAQEMLATVKQRASDEYKAVTNQIIQDVGDPNLDVNQILTSFKEKLTNSGLLKTPPLKNPVADVRLPERYATASLGKEDLGQRVREIAPKITEGKQDLLKVYEQLNQIKELNNGKIPASALLDFRQSLDDLIHFQKGPVPKISSSGQQVLKSLRNDITQQLHSVDPRVAQRDLAYSAKKELYDNLQGKLQPDKVESTLNNIFGKNKEWQKLLFKELESQPNSPEILNTLLNLRAGEKLSPLLPRGNNTVGAGLTGGLAAYLMSNPVAGVSASAFSPRIIGYLTRSLGNFSRSSTPALIRRMSMYPGFVRAILSHPEMEATTVNALKQYDSIPASDNIQALSNNRKNVQETP